MEFWDTGYSENSRKALVIPNITNSQNIEKDSFVDVIFNHINALKQFGDYYWHIILPKPVRKLNLENVKQHFAPISGDMIYMRTSFPREIINLMKNIEYDVVYSHLPDWYMVARYTDKKIVGYSHWWEMKSCNSEDRKNRSRNFDAEILGVLKMDTCFLNTQDQKNRVIKEASLKFNDQILQQLDEKLQVWNLGVPPDKILKDSVSNKEKIIVFNHRAAAYKGYPRFLELMQEYRTRRDDFTVWVPQLQEDPPFNWITNTKVDKEEYYRRLQICSVGVQMIQSNYGWSVSATDCMMNGTPVIFQDSLCYREIDPFGMFFKYKKDFFDLLDSMLDDPVHRKRMELRSLSRAEELSQNEAKMIQILHKKLGD